MQSLQRLCAILLLPVGLLLVQCRSNDKSSEVIENISDTTKLDTTPITSPVTPPPPPRPIPDYDTLEWTDLHYLDESIVLDMRYATDSNFVEETMYDCGRCFLRPEVAQKIVKAHKALQEKGLGLKMFDCYRPRPIQWKLWKKIPDARYVSDPRKGSMHNRGAAVDLTIVDAEGKQLDMGTTFDFFGPRAWSTYQELPDSVLANRRLLRSVLEAEGFAGIRTEWWHFSYSGKRYEISDMLWNCE
ncbi:MAG: M15 family metallopeptidase [Saprospiraceae bacterium]|nr:M15 family metallopeptidase [Saprospiraceae bacterium]